MSKPRATTRSFSMDEANDPQIETPAYTESAGGRLRHEREAQHIPEKEAAHKLRLMVTDLRAIEADRYSASAHDDLLRKHLRDYANLLTLNPDSILAIYDRQAGTSFHRGAQRIGDIPKAQTTSVGSLLTGSLVVATVVLGFLVVMQFTNTSKVNALLAENDSGPRANALQSASQQTGDIDTTASTDEDFDPTPATVIEEGDAAMAPTEKSLDSVDMAAVHVSTSDGLDEQTSDGDLPVQTAAKPQPSVNNAKEPQNTSNALTEVAAAYRNESDAAPAADAAKTTDELAFRFAKDCWVEVYDADEKRLIAEIRKAGGSLQLSGKSPFRVLVGYSREVVLQFNGHPVEIEKIERSYSTLFRVERANGDTSEPTVTTIRRKQPDSSGKAPAKATLEKTRA
ncbi:MAG: RodZ domain-containing protein [Pseudomonadales bacterium]